MSVIYKTGLKFFGGRGLHGVWPFGQVYDWIAGKIKNYEWSEVHRLNGFVIYAPPKMRAAFAIYKGQREALEFRLFENEIPKGGTVIDVGANIGLYTLPFARAAGLGGNVFAFEPEPTNLSYLRKNISANGYGNVEVMPKAVGDHAGKVELFISSYNPGGHQIWNLRDKINALQKIGKNEKALLEDEHEAARRSIFVDLVTLDDYFKNYGKPINFIKMDVEGAEGGVIAGAKNILAKNKDLKLHFEFIPSVMRLFGTDPREFLNILAGYDFKFYSLLNYKKGIDELIPLTADELLARCPGNKSDEVFARKE